MSNEAFRSFRSNKDICRGKSYYAQLCWELKIKKQHTVFIFRQNEKKAEKNASRGNFLSSFLIFPDTFNETFASRGGGENIKYVCAHCLARRISFYTFKPCSDESDFCDEGEEVEICAFFFFFLTWLSLLSLWSTLEKTVLKRSIEKPHYKHRRKRRRT